MVDKFGSTSDSLGSDMIIRGKPGIGFKLTEDGDFDLENIRKEKESVIRELSDISSQLNESIETVGIGVVTPKNETDENHNQINSTKKSLEALSKSYDQLNGIVDEVSEKII